MNYKSTVNGELYSEPKYAPENLNFCASATLVSTEGGWEVVMERAIFPYRYGGEAQAVAEAKKYIAATFIPKLAANTEISLSLGAKPADEHWV